MGAQGAQVFSADSSLVHSFSTCSDVATKSDEGHESNESCKRCKGREGHDSNSRVQVSGRVYWSESEGREGNNGGLDGRGSRSVEKGWLLQDCRGAQLEAETETCNTCAKGRQPIHERALRLQSQASIKDREGTSDEEAQNAGELMMLTPALSLFRAQLRAFKVLVGGLTRLR